MAGGNIVNVSLAKKILGTSVISDSITSTPHNIPIYHPGFHAAFARNEISPEAFGTTPANVA